MAYSLLSIGTRLLDNVIYNYGATEYNKRKKRDERMVTSTTKAKISFFDNFFQKYVCYVMFV